MKFQAFSILYKKKIGVILTGIVIVFSFLMLTLGFLLISPIEMTYTRAFQNGNRIRCRLLAESGFAYFRQLSNGEIWNLYKKGKEKQFVIKEKGKEGWFTLKMIIHPDKKNHYFLKITGGVLSQKEKSMFLIELKYEKEKWVKISQSIEYLP